MTETFLVLFIIHALSVFSERYVCLRFDEEVECFLFAMSTFFQF